MHQLQRQVDVGTRNDVARQLQLQPCGQHGSYHQQGRDVLRTHVARQLYFAARQPGAGDTQGREAFVARIRDVCAQRAQGVHQDADGALLHAFGAGDDVCARRHAEVGGEETHGRAGGVDVYHVGHVVQGAYHDLRVVAVAQVLGACGSSRQGVEDERAVADALRGGQLYGGVQRGGGGESVLHVVVLALV